MDQLALLKDEALKLPPEERLRLADLLYASVEAEDDAEWRSKVSAELESRWEAYEKGELGFSEGLGFLDRIESR